VPYDGRVSTAANFISVCVAGAIGTGARYLIATWSAEKFGPGFPYGTLFVNVLGCFLIALIMQTAVTNDWSPGLRVTLTAGFLGGFTTYSAFNFEALALMQSAPGLAGGYLLLTLVGGFVAGWLGLLVARLVAA
jgi:CrcB protein